MWTETSLTFFVAERLKAGIHGSLDSGVGLLSVCALQLTERSCHRTGWEEPQEAHKRLPAALKMRGAQRVALTLWKLWKGSWKVSLQVFTESLCPQCSAWMGVLWNCKKVLGTGPASGFGDVVGRNTWGTCLKEQFRSIVWSGRKDRPTFWLFNSLSKNYLFSWLPWVKANKLNSVSFLLC